MCGLTILWQCWMLKKQIEMLFGCLLDGYSLAQSKELSHKALEIGKVHPEE